MNDMLRRLILQQAGMVARRQLRQHGISWDTVAAQLRGRRWVERTPRVISTFTGTPTTEQLRWLGVLHAGPRSMLRGLTAAAAHGLMRWDRAEVTVIVDDELSFEPVEGVRFFRSRRPFDLLLSARPGIPRCALEPAVLLWGGYEAAPRAAHGVVCATIQQRLSTPERMLGWVDQLRPLRRARAFRRTIGEIAGGVHSMVEADVTRMCRRFSMPLPDRQVSRTDNRGNQRWTDAEWTLPDGSVLVLEIDGAFHVEVPEYQDDVRRVRRLSGPNRTIIRCTGYELRHEQEELAFDLITLGVPGRLHDTAA